VVWGGGGGGAGDTRRTRDGVEEGRARGLERRAVAELREVDIADAVDQHEEHALGGGGGGRRRRRLGRGGCDHGARAARVGGRAAAWGLGARRVWVWRPKSRVTDVGFGEARRAS
jgi:hypothetical protein